MNDEWEYLRQRIDKLKSLVDCKPTIEPSKTTPTRLVIGYDKSTNGDDSCLIVGKQYDGTDEVFMVNEFYNEKADELYRYLTTPSSQNPFQNSSNEKV